MENLKQPAFPQLKGLHNSVNTFTAEVIGGMTKMEYAIIHAPNEIPEWFEHSKLDKPKQPKSWIDLPDTDPFKEELKGWTHDPCYDLEEAIEWYQIAWEKYWKESREWEQQDKSARYFQWRFYFANAILFQTQAGGGF